MTNYIGEGEVITFTAPVGGVTSGVPVLIGSILVLPQATALVGVAFAGVVGGLWRGVAKKTGTAWATEGAEVYYYTSGADTGKFHTVSDANNRCAGVVVETALSGATSGVIRANPFGLTIIGDITGVTAGTGLTGGGTSGTVTLATDTALIPTMPAVGGAGNLVLTAAADRALSNASVVAANVVTEAAVASGADQVVTSAGASKIVKDSGVAIGNVPTMAAVGGAGNLVGTAAADKALSDSGVVIANVVTQAAVASGADQIVTSAGASKVHKDSAVVISNVPTMAAVGGAGNLVGTAAADKALSDSGVVIANVPSMAAAGGAGNLVGTAAADKALSDSGVVIANVPSMAAAAGGAGNIVRSGGADKTLTDGGAGFEVAIANVPTMAAVGGAGNLIQTAAADKALSDGGILAADVVTAAAAAAGPGTLWESGGGADKTAVDSTILSADVVTMAAAAAAAEMVAMTSGASRLIEDSTSPLILAAELLATNMVGMVHCLEVDVEAAAAVIGVFNANCPWNIRIIGFDALCTAPNAGGTAKLNDAFAGGGTDITDAVIMAVQDVLSHAVSIVGAVKNIPLAGSLSVVKNAAGDDGKVYIYFVRT